VPSKIFEELIKLGAFCPLWMTLSGEWQMLEVHCLQVLVTTLQPDGITGTVGRHKQSGY